MKHFISLLIILLIFITVNYAQQPWFQLTSGQNNSLNEIQFTDSLNGFYCHDWSNGFIGFGGVNKSTNGGQSWFSVFSGIPVNCLFFVNNNTGWFAGNYWDDGLRTSREIYKTTNGGINFTRQFIDSLRGFFTDMHFTNVNFGYCVTNQGRVFRTTNSGNNWSILDSLGSDLNGVHFTNSSTGYVISYLGNVYKTTNSGNNWSFINMNNYLSDVFFINENTGWICGAFNNLYKTTDGWATRESIPFNFSGITNIHFVNPQTGWASGGNGQIIYTTNGGYNWATQNSGTNHGLSSIYFINDRIGWVLGNLFVNPFLSVFSIHKTTNGGLSSLVHISSEIPDRFSIEQNYPNPFNPNTKIKFNIAKISHVQILIYDILGKEIEKLVNQSLSPGTYEADFDGTSLTSGIYFYKLITESYSETKKMVLAK